MSNLAFSPNVINTWHVQSIGNKLVGLGDSATSVASTAYPSANLAIYIPFFMRTPFLVAQLAWLTGATATTDSVDMGIYSADGRQILHTGATVLSGGTAPQVVNVTDVYLGAGSYFFAIAQNGTSAGLSAQTFANAGFDAMCGIYQQASAYTLPAIATFASPTFSYVPMIGFTARTVF